MKMWPGLIPQVTLPISHTSDLNGCTLTGKINGTNYMQTSKQAVGQVTNC